MSPEVRPSSSSSAGGACRRFTRSERLSFGRWGFLTNSAKCLDPLASLGNGAQQPKGETGSALGARALSAPTLDIASVPSPLRRPSARRHAGDMDAIAAASQESVKSLLDRLLPVGCTPESKVCSPSPLRGAAWAPEAQTLSSPGGLHGDRGGGSGTGIECSSPTSTCSGHRGGGQPDSVLRCGASGRFRKQVLERFRQQLLQHFLSLHDAFSRLDHGVSRDRSFTTKEFHHALGRLGVGQEDADEIFLAMDTNKVGVVSLSEFLHALVDVSPQALLWELRCRLLQSNIGVRNLKRALDLVRWPQHGWRSKATELKRRTTRETRDCSAGASVDHDHDRPGTSNSTMELQDRESARVAGTAPMTACSKVARSPYYFNRGDWLKLCTSIYLTLLEADRLFLFLADASGHVDLQDMFELLRTTVEPDVTLERFATKVVAHYETLDTAFDTFCEHAIELESEDGCLRWEGFRALAVTLHVNDGNAANIWSMLTGTSEVPDVAGDTMRPESPGANDDGCTRSSVTRTAFVGHLSLWGPDSALRALKEHLCERFGNLAECQRVMKHRLTDIQSLSASEFEAALHAEGVRNCDVQTALRTLASKRGDDAGHLSLEATMNAMRALRRGGRRAVACARSTVKHETLPIWEQLREVKNELSRRDTLDDADCRHDCQRLASCFGRFGVPPETRPNTAPGLLPTVADKRRFSEAVHGAVKSAETSRSKSVLQSAHRQVLRLEERWATGAGRSAISQCNSLRRDGKQEIGRKGQKDFAASLCSRPTCALAPKFPGAS